jgi:hypothetical protein
MAQNGSKQKTQVNAENGLQSLSRLSLTTGEECKLKHET